MYTSFDMERWVCERAKNPSRTDFERDRARVLHSSALRRLAAKTQVLGPESNDFIRNRLTHSLEVAQIGRSLAKNLGADQDVVETACLAHDIGHPPFGHNGETVLNDIAADIGGFEGNAQTLRVLTRLEPKRFHPQGRSVGLNLTRATIDATIKYPWVNGKNPAGPSAAKFGVYDEELDAFDWVRGDRQGTCVEAQLMDLSDDIAYSIHDIEDAIVRRKFNPDAFGVRHESGVDDVITATLGWYGEKVSAEELAAAANRLFSMPSWPHSYAGTLRDLARLKDLTSDLIGRFISAICQATREKYDHALTRYAGNVVVPAQTRAEIMFLKGIAVYFVMAPRESDQGYIEQRTILMDLADVIEECPQERLEPHFADMWEQARDNDARWRVVVDQLASLTDQSAREWHSRYCGMLRH
ncbi:deoxyguanosinetriphosphate triphosphohydrolase [Trueperella sp. LYQ143]|uniref:deoxyguanosinetriphosphate triphosphohydrolase n=1 Tax=unclassified Trueperella TaxID=2630174 RepID=UPI003983D1AA